MRCRFFRDINWRHGGIPIVLLSYVLFAFFKPRQFALSDFEFLSTEDIASELKIHIVGNRTLNLPKCPLLPSNDKFVLDEITQNTSNLNLEETNLIQTHFHTYLGGRWEPSTCLAQHYVAIIVPYKNRPEQLKQFLTYMHQFLQIQMIHYQIFIIEQVDDNFPFNRGKLLNIGFIEATRYGGFHCIIMHDVDLLPENIKNIYGCTRRPRHMSAVVNSFRYTLQYENLFGGVLSISSKLFKSVNGFSNTYFGWGGEDDNFGQRLESQNIPIIRFSPAISSYHMMPHAKENPNDARFEKLRSTTDTFQSDGLNTLTYSVVNFITLPLHTLIQFTTICHSQSKFQSLETSTGPGKKNGDFKANTKGITTYDGDGNPVTVEVVHDELVLFNLDIQIHLERTELSSLAKTNLQLLVILLKQKYDDRYGERTPLSINERLSLQMAVQHPSTLTFSRTPSLPSLDDGSPPSI